MQNGFYNISVQFQSHNHVVESKQINSLCITNANKAYKQAIT